VPDTREYYAQAFDNSTLPAGFFADAFLCLHFLLDSPGIARHTCETVYGTFAGRISMASVRHIAKLVGVSAATVSRALNNHPTVAPEVRGKVLAAMNRSRYVPTIGRRNTSNLAFAYIGEPTLGSPFDAALIQGMSDKMTPHGLDLIILNLTRSKLPHETYSQMFIRKGVRGAVLRASADSKAICEQVAAEGFPVVAVGERFEEKVSCVYADSTPSSREAVQYLCDLGHKRVAICLNETDDSDHQDRLAGYREALNSRGIDLEPEMILRARAQREGGVQLMRRWRNASERPRAIYFADPMTAVGALNEARKIGIKVPEELSIIGFDDSDLRFMVYPTLTTVCQDAIAIGREAFDALHTILDAPGGAAPIRRVLSTWLEVHGSTAGPRAG
jgi:DNA-binding LacI/PurR family transcriptional regulator